MVLVSYSGREINAKLVYYGPGLSGKTTNLEYIYSSIPQTQRGKMVSMKTKTERTLFFDFLPVNLGELSGFKTRFLLYTVPGQVYYNATRKLVLKGVDSVVFVADSKRGKMDENVESLENLKENLREHGLSLEEVPWVIQYNKRDLSDVYTMEELEGVLNPARVPSFEAVAMTGQGVVETFKGVSRLLLRKLAREIGVTPSAQPGAEMTPAPAAPAVAPVPTSAPAPFLAAAASSPQPMPSRERQVAASPAPADRAEPSPAPAHAPAQATAEPGNPFLTVRIGPVMHTPARASDPVPASGPASSAGNPPAAPPAGPVAPERTADAPSPQTERGFIPGGWGAAPEPIALEPGPDGDPRATSVGERLRRWLSRSTPEPEESRDTESRVHEMQQEQSVFVRNDPPVERREEPMTVASLAAPEPTAKPPEPAAPWLDTLPHHPPEREHTPPPAGPEPAAYATPRTQESPAGPEPRTAPEPSVATREGTREPERSAVLEARPAPRPPVAYEAPPAPRPPEAYEAPPAPRPPVAYEAPPAPRPPVAYEAPPAPKPPVAYEAPPAPKRPVAYEAPPAPRPPVAFEAPPVSFEPRHEPDPVTAFEARPAPEPPNRFEMPRAPERSSVADTDGQEPSGSFRFETGRVAGSWNPEPVHEAAPFRGPASRTETPVPFTAAAPRLRARRPREILVPLSLEREDLEAGVVLKVVLQPRAHEEEGDRDLAA